MEGYLRSLILGPCCNFRGLRWGYGFQVLGRTPVPHQILGEYIPHPSPRRAGLVNGSGWGIKWCTYVGDQDL